MMSILKKIVLFPVSLFVAFLALMAKWLLTLSSYVVAPLMLYIFGCGIYTAYRQTWDQFFILLVAEFICFVLFFGATAITEDIGRFSEWLAELSERVFIVCCLRAAFFFYGGDSGWLRHD